MTKSRERKEAVGDKCKRLRFIADPLFAGLCNCSKKFLTILVFTNILFLNMSNTAHKPFKLFGENIMNKIAKIAAATALVAASASASAWWGGPMSSFTDEFFGDGNADGAFDMSFSANANTRASGRGYGYGQNRYYNAPYAYGPYGYGHPYAPVAPVAPAAPVAQAPVAK